MSAWAFFGLGLGPCLPLPAMLLDAANNPCSASPPTNIEHTHTPHPTLSCTIHYTHLSSHASPTVPFTPLPIPAGEDLHRIQEGEKDENPTHTWRLPQLLPHPPTSVFYYYLRSSDSLFFPPPLLRLFHSSLTSPLLRRSSTFVNSTREIYPQEEAGPCAVAAVFPPTPIARSVSSQSQHRSPKSHLPLSPHPAPPSPTPTPTSDSFAPAAIDIRTRPPS